MKTHLKTLSALSLCAMMGPIHRSSVRFDKALTDDEFQTKVLDEVEELTDEQKAQQKKLSELTENVGNLQKETKTALEELTKAKNTFNGLESSVRSFELAMQKVNLQMTREKRMSFGDPVQRISNDDEKRARFNAAIRLACGLKMPGAITVAKNIVKGIPDLETKIGGEDSGWGSTLITPDLAKDIYDTLAMFGAWNTLGVRSLGTKVTNLPVKTARAKCIIIDEGGTIPEDATKAGTSVTLTAKVLAVYLTLSNELLEDAEIDVTADVMDDFLESFNERMDYLSFSGQASGNGALDGPFTGLFYGGTAVNGATGHVTMEQMVLQDFINVMLGVDVGILSRPARWWVHPFMLTRMLNIKDTTGRPIFLTIMERPAANALGTILGYPVTLVNNAPSTNAASNPVIAFGDGKAQTVGVRTQFKFDTSKEVAFQENETAFRGVGRAGTVTRRAQGIAVLKTPAS